MAGANGKSRRARRAGALVRKGVAVGFVALQACVSSHEDESPPSVAGNGSGASTSGGAGNGGAGAGFSGGTAGFVLPTFDAGAGITTPLTPPAGPSFDTDRVKPPAVARRTLYSWTTAAQYQALRDDQVLLLHSESSTKGTTNLRGTLDAMATAGDPLAAVLTSAPFQKGRFAWPNAWATLRGWPGESYGDKLVRITLRPDAWIASLVRGVLTITDANDVAVPLSEALATPERIAAVYFVNDPAGPSSYCGSFINCATGAYREFFVNNEAMVEEWAVGTQDVRDELLRSLSVITDFKQAVQDGLYVPASQCELSGNALCSWISWPRNSPIDRYLESLSIASEYYLPTEANLTDLIAALQAALFVPDPLVVGP